MSTIAATNLKNASSGSNNIVLGTDGSTRVSTLADSAGANTSTPAQIASGRAKAWVNFNGTGTVAIRTNYNVSSITDNGVGDYTVNFTTAMTDADYSAVTSAEAASIVGLTYYSTTAFSTRTSSSVRILIVPAGNNQNYAGQLTDTPTVCVTIFR
jgi:hypothetical protein